MEIGFEVFKDLENLFELRKPLQNNLSLRSIL